MIEIPGYTIGECLSDDGVRTIHRAVRLHDAQRVVVKSFHQEYPDPHDLARLKHEYRIAGLLSGQAGVVQVLDLLTVGNGETLVLEDFGGIDLGVLLQTGPLPLNNFTTLALHLVDALAQIHAVDVIHKDIKPANIIVDPTAWTLKLTDFGISLAMAEETQDRKDPGELEGSLAYMSPEQTGRTGLPTDYRSDFYALGATLYEMLTGHVPFAESDPTALIHAHIAKMPVSADIRNPAVPTVLAAMVQKCLAKTPDDRYQSAFGIKADLLRAQTDLQQTGAMSPFVVGSHDVTAKLRPGRQRFGRASQVAQVRAVVSRVAAGKTEILLVRGDAGMGKTAFAADVFKCVDDAAGLFGYGAFTQATERTPYSAIAKICARWVKRLEAQPGGFEKFALELREAAGANLPLLLEVVPDLQNLVGAATVAPASAPREAQHQFVAAFRTFINVLRKHHRLAAMYLDDVQWADAASLHLVTRLLVPGACPGLLIATSFRPDDAAAFAQSWHTTLTNGNAAVCALELSVLDGQAVHQMLTEAMRGDSADSAPLAAILFDKTRGNPLFVRQLLDDLARRKLLAFDHDAGRWRYDVDVLRAVDVTANVADLLSKRLHTLDENVLKTLQVAACIGLEFDLASLVGVRGIDPYALHRDLWQCIEHGLLAPIGDAYKAVQNGPSEQYVDTRSIVYRFTHSHVQQATDRSLTVVGRQTVHLALGRMLLADRDPETLTDDVFVVANHLSQAIDRVTDAAERERVCVLSCRAGDRARSTAAFGVACDYLMHARALMPADMWVRRYPIAFAAHLSYAECLAATGNLEQALGTFDETLQRAQNRYDQGRLLMGKVLTLWTLGRHNEGIDVGLAALALFDVHLPRYPTAMDIGMTMARGRLAFMRTGRTIEELRTLPSNQSPEYELLMVIVLCVIVCANNAGNIYLYGLSTVRLFELTLKFGTNGASAAGYVGYGLALAVGMGNYADGLRFGSVGLQCLELATSDILRVLTLSAYCMTMWHFAHPMRDILPKYDEVEKIAINSGNLVWAGYARYGRISTMMHAGAPLDEVKRMFTDAMPFFAEIKYSDMSVIDMHVRFLDALLDDAHAAAFLNLPRDSGDKVIMERFFGVLNMMYRTIMGDSDKAALAGLANRKSMEIYSGLVLHTVHTFYLAMALMQAAPSGGWSHVKHRRVIGTCLKKLKVWARLQPGNFRARYLLVRAEVRRLKGQYTAALDLYDAAVRLAEENGAKQDVAMASECAARYCNNEGNVKLAKLYLTEARYQYRRWGALAKVKQLEVAYPHLVYDTISDVSGTEPSNVRDVLSTWGVPTGSVHSLDVEALLKGAQLIAGEMQHTPLLVKLVRIAIENAGAERGFLILRQPGSGLVIEGAGVAHRDDMGVAEHIAVDAYPDIAASVIRHVDKTAEVVLLTDAALLGDFQEDPYVQRGHAKSILCAPVRHNREVMGILYLENNLITGAFTPARLELLNMLFAQAAISLENARVYEGLVAQENTLARELNKIYEQLADMQKEKSERQMAGGFAHEIRNALAGSQFVLAKCAGKMGTRDERSAWDLTTEQLANMLLKLKEWLEPDRFAEVARYAAVILANEKKIEEIVTEVYKGNERALSITQNIMEYVRTSEVRASGSTVDVNALVRRLVEQARDDFAQDNIDVRFRTSGQASIAGNEMELFSVVRNLLHNARDAVLESPTPQHIIDVESRGEEDNVTIRIADNGGGIADEHLPHIFDAFYSVRPSRGPGLGLSMVKKIVTLYGGQIDVATEEGRQSVFTVRLPRQRQRS